MLSILISFKMFLVNTFLFLPEKLSALILTEVTVFNIFPYTTTVKQVLLFIHSSVPFPSAVTAIRQPKPAEVHSPHFHFNSTRYSCLFPMPNSCPTWLPCCLNYIKHTPGRTASQKPSRTTYTFSTQRRLKRFERMALFYFLAS